MEHENITVDDLLVGGLRIIQPRYGYRAGIDAVLLAGFVRLTDGARVADLGAGTGALPLLLAARQKNIEIFGLELQREMKELAQRSVELNGLSQQISIYEGDIKDPPPQFKKGGFDVVVSNPPYIRGNQGRMNPCTSKSLAKHEVACCLENVVQAASILLRSQGSLFMIHRTTRMVEAIGLLVKYRLEPKRLCPVYSSIHRQSKLFLVEAVKDGRSGFVLDPPLVLSDIPAGDFPFVSGDLAEDPEEIGKE